MATKKPAGYHRLTDENRTLIYRWRQEGKPMREIARLLNVAPSTISREIERNSGQRGYRPRQASQMARDRVRTRARRPRRLTDAIWKEATERLSDGWSFDMVCGRAEKDGRAHVCRETLYRRYFAGQKRGEVLPPLPRSHRRRHRRSVKTTAGRGHIPNRTDISQRPRSIDARRRFGHWEGDLVCGLKGTGYFVTLVERKSRYALVARVPTKETEVVMQAVVRILGGLPAAWLKTLTFDNGKEFSRHEIVSGALGVNVFFARPYHSWERGTNENRNGVIRRVFPKGSSFADVQPEQMTRIDSLLNDRPMRRLDWRTPREAFEAHSRHLQSTPPLPA